MKTRQRASQWNPYRLPKQRGRQFTKQGIRRILAFAMWRTDGKLECHWCKVEAKEARELTVDHVIALGECGQDHPKNCVLACIPCNQRRGRETTQRLRLKGVGCGRWNARQFWIWMYGQYQCAI